MTERRSKASRSPRRPWARSVGRRPDPRRPGKASAKPWSSARAACRGISITTWFSATKGPAKTASTSTYGHPPHPREGAPAGDAVDLRRRLRGGRRLRAAPGCREPGEEGRGGGQHELPPKRIWILRACRACQRVGP